ncbi:MAG: DsbE family thiol:disulfide interchange protein [Legionellaceae bacterium]|nr:DsbE family thiol:disulfide interchange protein [Legionellaceae bacterium]MBP9775954.1 DsbE family thiol:disulfide interchange protein [Legionellaceae bacterium]
MKIIRLLPVAIFCVLATFFWYGLALDPQKLPTPKIGQALPNFDLPMLLGGSSQRFTPDLLRNHRSVLVVWASWCDACREEQAFLLILAQQKGIRLYGLNYKDDPAKAQQWLVDWGNPYQAIGVDRKGKLALDLGVYGAPETYLLDRQGKILHRYAGSLTAEVWQREFLALLM